MNFFLLIWLIFGTLLGQIITILIGYTILHFFPKNEIFPPLQRLAISYGLGTGFLSLSMFFCILFGIHARLSWIPLLIIVIFLFFYFKIFQIFKEDINKLFLTMKGLKFNIIEYFCVFLFIIELFLIFSYWFIYPIHSGDAVAVWDAAAKYFYYDGSFNYYKHAPLPESPSYPLLVPLNLCFYYSIYFQYHYFTKILFVSYFIFLIVFLYYSLRFFKLNRTYSFVISTFVAMNSDVFINATIAYADLAMTFFYTISTIFLFSYFVSKERFYLLYSSIFMGFMAWSKHEGLALLVVNVLIFIVYNIFLLVKNKIDYKKSLHNILFFFTIGFIIYLPWLIFCISNKLMYKNYNIQEIMNIQQTFTDISIILTFLIIPQNRFNASFLLFYLVFYFILMVNIKKVFKENTFFLLLLCISHFLLYIFFYIIYPSDVDLKWQLSVSLNREILHLIPICGFLLGILLSNNNKILLDNTQISNYKIFIYILSIFVVIIIIIDILFYDFISSIIDFLYNSLFK